MIAIDTNILVALHRSEYTYHQAATEAVLNLAEGVQLWAIPWPCIHEFLAVVTNARIFITPSEPDVAIEVISKLMESPSLILLGESPTHWQELSKLLLTGHVTGAKVHDARIAAICLQHKVSCLWTADRDFSRFPALKCHNPLVK